MVTHIVFFYFPSELKRQQNDILEGENKTKAMVGCLSVVYSVLRSATLSVFQTGVNEACSHQILAA